MTTNTKRKMPVPKHHAQAQAQNYEKLFSLLYNFLLQLLFNLNLSERLNHIAHLDIVEVDE